MSRDLFNGLSKLRGRSWDELRERSAQLVSSRLERSGPVARRFQRATAAPEVYLAERLESSVAPEGLLAMFREREPTRFFKSFADPAATRAALRRLDATAFERVVRDADRICDGYVNLLGHRDVPVGTQPDWHTDWLRGRRAPMSHWSQIPFLDASVVGDHKLVWELNRHQYFGILGRAYWRTGNERYAETFARHIESWITSNPAKLGVNWASSLELAFRAISWCWALHFFRQSPALTAPLYAKIVASLDLHARHIARYLSTYFSPNTHLTGEALGLYYIGTVCPELRHASQWREQGRRILVDQLDRHVQPDGVYFEQTTYYHRYTADFYTHLRLLSAHEGSSGSDRVGLKLQALLDCLMHLTRPDGRTPLIGDDDGGRLMMLDEREANDFRATLSTGAVVFRRPDYAAVASALAEETVWLVGPGAVDTWRAVGSTTPRETSRGFSDGGYFVMRDRWAPDAQFAVIDCGPHGTMNCGHAHSDALAIELAADGRAWLVDPGTYTYTTDPSDRDCFRHSAAHSTISIDGAPSSEPSGPFSWKATSTATLHDWRTHETFDYFAGSHDGFARLWPKAVHRRDFLYLKGRYWVIRDRVTAAGRHDVRQHFQLAPGVELHPIAHDTVVAVSEAPAATLRICALADTGRFEVSSRWVSPGYGVREPAPHAAFTVTGHDHAEIITLALPGRAVSSDATVTRQRTGATTVVQLRDHGVIDVLLLDATIDVTISDVSADAAWAWVRLSELTGEPLEFVLLGAQSLRVGDSTMALPNGSRFAAGRRGPSGWTIDSDAAGVRTMDGIFADGQPQFSVTR